MIKKIKRSPIQYKCENEVAEKISENTGTQED